MRSMVTYGSFLDATRDLSAEDFKEVWIAILEYGIDEIEPEILSPVAKMAFLLAKPNIDSNKNRRKKKDRNNVDDVADSENTSANNCEQLQAIESKNEHPSIDGDGDVDGDVDVNGDKDGDEENIKPSCPKPSRKRSKPVEPEADVPAIPLNDGTEWRPKASLYEEYEKTFPAVNIPQQFQEMRTWSLSNPKMKKTPGGVARFVRTWLEKEQNRAGRIPTNKASPYMESIANRVAIVDSW